MAKGDKDSFKNVFSMHLMQGSIVKAVDVEEEIRVLKEKFDVLNYGYDKRGNIDEKLLKPLKQFPQDKIKRITQIRKLYLPRWMSKNIVEYDVDSKEPVWEMSECQSNLDFLPFSSSVFLPNQHIISIGGLNNKMPNRQLFVSRVLKVFVGENHLEKLQSSVSYKCQEVQSLKIARGMMGTVYHKGYIYVAGGITTKTKDIIAPSIEGDQQNAPVIYKCERYNVKEDQWEVIAPMNERRKNPTLCALENGMIYAFGGCQREYIDFNSIERYIKADNGLNQRDLNQEFEYFWEELKIYQPKFVSLQIAYAVNNKTILLFGGSIQDVNDIQIPTNKVYRFSPETEELFNEEDLDEPLISIYPSFELENELLLVDEKQDLNCPKIIKYDITKFK